MRYILNTLGIAALVATAVACSRSSSRGVLRMPIDHSLQFDPARGGARDVWPDSLQYSGLLKFDQDLRVVPDLAVAFPDFSIDGRTLTFTIRSDAYFADGRKLTAASVAMSWTRALELRPRAPQALLALRDIVGARALFHGRSKQLTGVKVTGEFGLQVKLVRPTYSFLLDLALPPAAVIDTAMTKRPQWWRRGAGSGAFTIRSLGNPTVMVPNPHFYGGQLALRQIELRRINSNRQAQTAYAAHRLDTIAVESSQYAADSSLPGFVSAESTEAYYLVENASMRRSVRLGLDATLNRSQLSSSTSSLDPSDSLVPPSVPLYPAVSDIPPISTAAAPAALKRSAPVALVASTRPIPEGIYTWLSKTWTGAGLRLQNISPAPNQVRLVSINILRPDPRLWLRSVGLYAFGGFNAGLQRRLSRARRQFSWTDPTREFDVTNRAERYILRHALIIPLAVQRQGYLVSSKVQGLVATPFGLEPENENWASVSAG